MSPELKSEYRSDLFRHLDGLVTVPTAYFLHKSGILAEILKTNATKISSLASKFEANEGYLNVALRILASQGWLKYSIEQNDVLVKPNEKSNTAFGLFDLYENANELIHLSGEYHPRKFKKEPFEILKRLFDSYRFELQKSSNDVVESQIRKQILKHIEGVIVGPSTVALGMNGMFHKYFMQASFHPDEFHMDGHSFAELLDIFSFFGWFHKTEHTYSFTEKGIFYAKRASAYGVTVSYLPMFRKLNELILGDPTIFWNLPKGAKEIHVDRKMNVWGSGGAHSGYFKKVDQIIIDIFNQPLDQQPKGIIDVGCGNGAFLTHLFDVIESRTLRGQHLEEHPLILVGADYNAAALDVTRTNIAKANIWAKVIFGDISDPDGLADDLKKQYSIDLHDLLNVRTFLDHNRIWEEVSADQIANARITKSDGAFAFRGRRLSNAIVEENLRIHLNRWSPYFKKFGLLVIELHTLSPDLTSQNIGKTAATAYDATHGFSDQYIVSLDVFLDVAANCGLTSDEQHSFRFPDSEIATVSIHLLKKK